MCLSCSMRLQFPTPLQYCRLPILNPPQKAISIVEDHPIRGKKISPICWGPASVITRFLKGHLELVDYRDKLFARGTRIPYPPGERPTRDWITVKLCDIMPDPIISVDSSSDHGSGKESDEDRDDPLEASTVSLDK